MGLYEEYDVPLDRNIGTGRPLFSLATLLTLVVLLCTIGVVTTVVSLNARSSGSSAHLFEQDIVTIHHKVSLAGAPQHWTDEDTDLDHLYNTNNDGIYTNEVLDMILDDDLDVENNRPIIGVLSQEIDEDIARKLPENHNFTSYIAASYVKWAESGGARVVPVIIGKSQDYYWKLFQSINGLLLPGGSAPLTGSGGFAEVGMLFYKWAKQANDDGDYFPIWGTCNGFELLSVISVADDQSRLTDCYSEDQALPLHLRPNWRQSRIYGQAPRWVLRDLTKKRVTINFHHFCLTPTNFTKFGLHKFWNALSVNRDFYDLEYISTIEAKNYPFYGVQFHPEKNIFEWSIKEPKIPHSKAAVKVAGYLADFLVNQARNSQHSFISGVSKYLIYNYTPIFTGSPEVGSTFEQMYAF